MRNDITSLIQMFNHRPIFLSRLKYKPQISILEYDFVTHPLDDKLCNDEVEDDIHNPYIMAEDIVCQRNSRSIVERGTR